MNTCGHIAERKNAMTSGAIRILVFLAVLFVLPGCLTRIVRIHAPSDVMLEDEFVIAIDGIVSGHGGGAVGVALELPESFEFLKASYVCFTAQRPLRRFQRVEGQYKSREGHYVIVLGDSIISTRTNVDTVRVFVHLKATEVGLFGFSAATGALSTRESGGALWLLQDPPELSDFTMLIDPAYRTTIAVTEQERNGTTALALGGRREYLALPDTGLFRFTMEEDFTFETWFLTTSRNGVLISTRANDFATAHPFELRIDEYGTPALTFSDGRTVSSTRNRIHSADGRWHHVAVVYRYVDRTFSLFLNGNLIDTLSIDEPRNIRSSNSAVIGGRPTRSKFLDVMLEETRFWSSARSPEEVAHYRAIALSGYEQNLYALFTYDEGNDGLIQSIGSVEGINATAYNKPRLVPSTAPLKVELLSFTVSQQNSEVVLSWESFDDSQVKAYVIEKRTVAGKYSALSTVEPHPDNENHQVYRFTDHWSERLITYYRLRKINRDGSVLLSDEVPVGMEVILNFTLGVNDPNPFQSETTIPYSLSETTHVTLKVYDLMGREVAELVSEKQAAGNYQARFNGEGMPPGMYFYKMRTSTGALTKRMYLSR